MGGDRTIRYARMKDADVAYLVNGDGPIDLLVIPGLLNHIESAAVPEVARHYDRLAQFARVMLYDKRGTGLSGPLAAGGSPTIEDRVDEAIAVLDAIGSKRAAVYAMADGGPVAIVLAAMHPDRVTQLVVYGSSARLVSDEGYTEGIPHELVTEDALEASFRDWGNDDDPSSLALILPSRVGDHNVGRSIATMQRLAGSPRAAQQYFHVAVETDVRDVLAMVHTPTLVVHVSGDRLYPVEQGRYLASKIEFAQFVELEGQDHFHFWEHAGRVADDLETFITGRREVIPSDRSFAIVLFTDIVDSTRRLANLGDDKWRAVLERHTQLVAAIVPEYGGRLIKTTGDGILATFDGPSRAARCALQLVDAMAAAGIEIRAGLHAGEVEWLGDDIAGIAVHIAARVCAFAAASEVLTTATLRDLTAGSNIEFTDRGDQELRGVPGRRAIHAITG